MKESEIIKLLITLLTITCCIIIWMITHPYYLPISTEGNSVFICNSNFSSSYYKKVLKIPRTIIQSWKTKESVPARIFQQFDQYAPEYQYKFFNDSESIHFMQTNFLHLLPIYSSLKSGAHKADLFRYCYLYLYGGIWIDIKTILIKPLKHILTDEYGIYTVKSIMDSNGGSTCYQGIIAVPPKTNFMQDMISSFILAAETVDKTGYLTFCRQMYHYFEKNYDQVIVGKNNGNSMLTLYLFEEYNKTICPTKLDRYNVCTYVRDENGQDLFKIRDNNFPW